jgi:hypothetical protein
MLEGNHFTFIHVSSQTLQAEDSNISARVLRVLVSA